MANPGDTLEQIRSLLNDLPERLFVVLARWIGAWDQKRVEQGETGQRQGRMGEAADRWAGATAQRGELQTYTSQLQNYAVWQRTMPHGGISAPRRGGLPRILSRRGGGRRRETHEEANTRQANEKYDTLARLLNALGLTSMATGMSNWKRIQQAWSDYKEVRAKPTLGPEIKSAAGPAIPAAMPPRRPTAMTSVPSPDDKEIERGLKGMRLPAKQTMLVHPPPGSEVLGKPPWMPAKQTKTASSQVSPPGQGGLNTPNPLLVAIAELTKVLKEFQQTLSKNEEMSGGFGGGEGDTSSLGEYNADRRGSVEEPVDKSPLTQMRMRLPTQVK